MVSVKGSFWGIIQPGDEILFFTINYVFSHFGLSSQIFFRWDVYSSKNTIGRQNENYTTQEYLTAVVSIVLIGGFLGGDSPQSTVIS